MFDDREDDQIYLVVMNGEEQLHLAKGQGATKGLEQRR